MARFEILTLKFLFEVIIKNEFPVEFMLNWHL